MTAILQNDFCMLRAEPSGGYTLLVQGVQDFDGIRARDWKEYLYFIPGGYIRHIATGRTSYADFSDAYASALSAFKNETARRITERRDALQCVIREMMGLCFYNTDMALEFICEALDNKCGISATYAGRSIYIDGRRVASIKTCVEPCEDARVIAIYEYKIL